MRNLGVGYLVIAGILTDQCVESAVRDACDKGYLVTLVTDACTTHSQARHDNALGAISGYCRQRTTEALPPDPSMTVTPGPSELRRVIALPRKSIVSMYVA